MKRMKQVLAGLLLAVMLVAGLTITPMDAEAAETVVNGENGVIYVFDEVNYNFKTLWATRTAPTREDYVFGGWYTTEDEITFKPVAESAGNSVAEGTKVWAKFVPAEVLSVRAQLQATTEAVNGENVASTYLRLLSGVNGLDYKKVGFDILYNKNFKDPSAENNEKATNITKVFSKVTNTETGEEGIVASAVFGSAATHFSVLRLADIQSANYQLVIYVTPHWTTLDGTTVYGQAKYVRVMDGYKDNHFISVPINFLTGSKVVAGQMALTYDSSKLEVVQIDGMAMAGFDNGTLMDEMNYYDDKAGTIKMVGSASDNTNIEPEGKIYANVWFKVKDNVDTTNVTAWEFKMNELSFCNWEEDLIKDVTAWDVKHLK